MMNDVKINELFYRDQIKLLYNYFREFGNIVIIGNLHYYYNILTKCNSLLNSSNYIKYNEIGIFLNTIDSGNIIIALELLNTEVNNRSYV